jgi:protein-disulfide isomerase
MQNRMKMGLAAVTLAALSLFAYKGGGTLPAIAQTDSFSEGQVRSIEKIVKDYLLSHPEVMLEVQEAYEKKVEGERVEATQARLPSFYKSLASMSPQLSGLSVGNGDVTVVEFFDYNCGYCRKTLPDLVKLVENDPKVKVQFMEFPILAPESIDASKVAIAAAKQGKYFEFHKAMFAAGRATKEGALKIAEQLGLDMKRLKADSESPETETLISKIADLGKQMHIDGTPTFVVGDKTNPGWTRYEELKDLVDAARKDGCKACAGADGAKDEKKS